MPIPESRSYVHLRCREATEVSGPEFAALADPLANMHSTTCAKCDDDFPLAEFAWSDTQEPILAYYQRYAARVSPSDRRWASRAALIAFGVVGLITGFVVGALSATFLGVFWGLIVAVVVSLSGGALGLIVHAQVVSPAILHRALGVSDPRLLR